MKTQKPVPAVIRMALKDDRYDGEELISLSTTMLQDGLILPEPRELRRDPQNSGILELTCTFVDQNAAKNWRAFPKVREYCRDIFKKHLKGNPKIIRYRNVIYDVDNIRSCACDERSAFLLSPDPFGHFSSIVCGGCLNPIPLYLFPDDLGIDRWQYVYAHVYLIWLNSDILETWAESQLGDYNSELNCEARKIISRLRKYKSVPSYYYIWIKEFIPDMPCPHCGRKGQKSLWEKPAKICRKCKLVFGY